MSQFARCFPSGDGMMLCEHWNGSWIAFPMRDDYVSKSQIEKSPEEDDSTDDSH